MSAKPLRPATIPCICGMCVVLQVLLIPDLHLPLPIGAEDIFIGDLLLHNFPLRVATLQMDGSHLYSLLTYALLHGSWMHLALNLLGLWLTGTTLERLLGWQKTLWVVLAGALAGAAGFLLSLQLDPRLPDTLSCIGASAILTSCLGTITTLFPKSQSLILFFGIPFHIKTILLVPLFLLFCVIECLFPELQTAYGAHLGGWIAGLLFGYLFRKDLTAPERE